MTPIFKLRNICYSRYTSCIRRNRWQQNEVLGLKMFAT